MSSPEFFYIGNDMDKPMHDEDKFNVVWLGKLATPQLFEYLLPLVKQHFPEFTDDFETAFFCQILSITALSERHYPKMVAFIMQAADELEYVKPFKQALQDALQADPRYVAHAA